ncbi:MAG: hypothetical protein AB1705_03920 [Verrucomicrobiota bacterium]
MQRPPATLHRCGWERRTSVVCQLLSLLDDRDGRTIGAIEGMQGDIADKFSVEALRRGLGGVLDAPLRAQGGLGSIQVQRPLVANSRHTASFLVCTRYERPAAMLICSPAVQPDHAERAVARARLTREVLGAELGRVVLQPLATGWHEGLSYALWPYRIPLSNRRGVWRLQRMRLRPCLLEWLREATRHTVREVFPSAVDDHFVAPLQSLRDDAQFSAPLREHAAQAVHRLHNGAWKPVHVFEHNDLWKDNILLNAPVLQSLVSTPPDGLFSIIDWWGAKAEGYGIYDLIHLAESLRLSRTQLAREVDAHCRILGCELADARGYLLAALGWLRLNLEGFPMERFLALAESCSRSLDTVLEDSP